MADRTFPIKELIDRYLDAYNARDIDALMAAVATDDSLIVYGTDEGENWHGWRAFSRVTEKLFHAVEEIRWERGEPKVSFSADGNIAWFAEELVGRFMVLGVEHRSPIRFSGVAENRGGEWKIVQIHRSVAVEGVTVPYLESHGVRFD